jgi:hypothetical protein
MTLACRVILPVQRLSISFEFLRRQGWIGEARERLRGKKLLVDVAFTLLEGRPGEPDTRGKKDLDNLLKPLLDMLQGQLDAGGRKPGWV